MNDVIFHLWEVRDKLELVPPLRNYLIIAVRNKCLNYLALKQQETEIRFSTIEQAGMPMRMCELNSCQDRAVYVERVSLDSPANVRKAKSAIRRAFKVQDLKLGFAFVEFLSICPTIWGLTAPKAMEWLRENMMPYYPEKQFKCPEEVKEVK